LQAKSNLWEELVPQSLDIRTLKVRQIIDDYRGGPFGDSRISERVRVEEKPGASSS
jgi:hypothetical protein